MTRVVIYSLIVVLCCGIGWLSVRYSNSGVEGFVVDITCLEAKSKLKDSMDYLNSGNVALSDLPEVKNSVSEYQRHIENKCGNT